VPFLSFLAPSSSLMLTTVFINLPPPSPVFKSFELFHPLFLGISWIIVRVAPPLPAFDQASLPFPPALGANASIYHALPTPQQLSPPPPPPHPPPPPPPPPPTSTPFIAAIAPFVGARNFHFHHSLSVLFSFSSFPFLSPRENPWWVGC